MQTPEILVLDFGSQYTQLIARRLREYGIYTEIVPYFEKLDVIKAKNPKGIILSGGPASVYEKDAYKPDPKIFDLQIPILGICYGMQYISDFFGGKVIRAEAQEFGKAKLTISEPLPLTHIRVIEASLADEKALLFIWEESVKKTHDFLEKEEITHLKPEVLEGLQKSKVFMALHDDTPISFIGIQENEISMFFMLPSFMDQGVGKKLLSKAYQAQLQTHDIIKVTCNEQNIEAMAFYKHLGFELIKRSEQDEQNRPYPLCYLEISNKSLQHALSIIKTERFMFHELSHCDMSDLSSMLKDEKVMEAWEYAFDDECVKEWFDKQQERYYEHNFGLWSVREKETSNFVGQVGLSIQDIGEGQKGLEVGYVLKKEFWKKGFGFEAASACIEYAFKKLGYKKIYAIIKNNNEASIKLAQKLGMQPLREIKREYKGKIMPHTVYVKNNDAQIHSPLFEGVKQDSIVWMSHADKVESIPDGFIELAKSGNTTNCAIANVKKHIYALQFHPEVVHSECGAQMLYNFATKICEVKSNWDMQYFAKTEITKLKEIVFGINQKAYTLEESEVKNTPKLSTQRLILRRFEEKDIEAILKLYSDLHTNMYLPWEACQIDNLAQAKDIFEQKYLAAYAKERAYYYAICLKEDDIPIGFVHLDDHEPYDLGYALKSEYWNKGYASEATKAVLSKAKEDGIPYITATHDENNLASAKVMQKLGMDYQYAYKELWQPKNKEVNFYLYQINFTQYKTYQGYADKYGKLDVNKPASQIAKTANKVLCAVSGGVDSSVVATLLYKAIGDHLIPVFVDTGLLRKGEREAVEAMFRENLGVPLITVDASEIFLGKLKGVRDPEMKRKIIGETFIEVFEAEAKKHNANGEIKFLAQGTLYPDVIESVSVKGPSKTIKSHHNVGGLPEWMKFELIEPLRELFKDEVRALGRELGMPESMLMRHPFPGPGLAIRIMGEVNEGDLELLRRADTIFLEELHKSGYYSKVWQAFCVLLNVRSVGVMGDNRTYDNTICLRAVSASDGMTATFSHIPHEFLESVSTKIINEVEGINRVVYDITSKPPGTIEWE